MNAPLHDILARVTRRLRWQRAADLGVSLGVAGCSAAIAVLGLHHLRWIDRGLHWAALLCLLPLGSGLLIGALRRITPLLPAQLLDQTHELQGRVANALAFSTLPEAEQTPFMRAAIADANGCKDLEPSRAYPLRKPPRLSAYLALSIVVMALALWPRSAPPTPPERPTVAPPIQAELLDRESLEAFEADLEPITADAETAEDVQELSRALNEILENIADRQISRSDALREIQRLETQLAEGRPADPEAMQEALAELGRQLASPETEGAAEALQNNDAGAAANALRESAENIDDASRRELQRLRRALERAAQSPEERLLRQNEAEQERERRLLERESEGNQQSESRRRLLQRRQRRLDSLRREQQALQERRRRLERLRRELNQAAQGLNRNGNQSQAQEALRRAAEELNRRAREQMSEEQRQELQRQMQQLREALRRMQQGQQNGNGQNQGGQGQNGQGRQQRLQRFRLAAGGQGSVRLQLPNGQGQNGQGQNGQGQNGQGQNGQGQNGQGQNGQGQNGQGQNGQGQTLTLGAGNGQSQVQLELPGQGQGQGEGQGQGQGLGEGIGDGHSDDALSEDPSHLGGTHQNSRIQGAGGSGPSRSEVILGASERGFAARNYEEVFTDYENHAEEVLERDEVPPGYRFYIRRYFQLIRPRSESQAAPDAASPSESSTP